MSSLLPAATRSGTVTPCQFVAGDRLPRAANAGGERSQVRARLLGEGAKRVPARIGHVGTRRRLERRRDRLRGQPRSIDKMNPDPAEDRRTHPLRMRDREDGRDPAAQRITHDISARYFEMIEQCAHVLRHQATVIGGRIVEFGRRAMATIVERDHAAARARQRRHPARIDPVHFLVGSKTVDEHDRLALPFVEIGDLDLTMREMRHAPAYSRSPRLCTKAAGEREGG